METNQKYIRLTIYYNGHIGVNSVLRGRSIAAKISDYLTSEENEDDLHDMCYNYLRGAIKNSKIEYALSWGDIVEWDFAIIDEKELLDNAYDAEIIDTEYFCGVAVHA